jgi:hypothetical protein
MSTDDAERVISQKDLVSLVKDANLKRTRMQSISGELGERVKTFIETKHLNRAAYTAVAKLCRMDDEDKRNDFLRSFELYLDYCRKDGLLGSEHAGDLVDQANGEDDAAAAQVAQNTARLESGIKAIDPTFEDDAESDAPSRRNQPANDDAEAKGTYREH